MNTFNSINVTNFDLDKTLTSGQFFVWEKSNEYWVGATIDGLIVLLQPNEHTILWQTYPENNNLSLVTRYLRLDFDIDPLAIALSKDAYTKKAYDKYRGLRLLRQNVHEATISFIVSANNNIPAIRKSIKKLSTMCNRSVLFQNKEYYLFPKISAIAELSIEELKTCSFGYRAKYIKESAARLITWNLENFTRENEATIRNDLLTLPGVGNKVADCVLCYALGFDNVTPLDVWGQRILTQYYDIDPKLSYEKMRNWTQEKFFGYAAWAGQYLFEYIRNSSK